MPTYPCTCTKDASARFCWKVQAMYSPYQLIFSASYCNHYITIIILKNAPLKTCRMLRLTEERMRTEEQLRQQEDLCLTAIADTQAFRDQVR